MFDQTIVEYTLFGMALLSILLPLLAGKMKLPVFQVFGRWIRWFLFAGLVAFFLKTFEISSRPDWLHFITALAGWFLLETGYNWIAIRALSLSNLPLFPNFKENSDGDEWPADRAFIDLKEWLRSNEYRHLTALKAELFEGTYLRASIYESEDRLTRVQILFLPKRRNQSSVCYTVSTLTKQGFRLITDNHFLPYGGYYPENWDMVRKPLTGDLPALLKLHRERVLKATSEPVGFEEEPLEELNNQQRLLERLNIEVGFLVPTPRQEEEGKITYEGRYRLWKEMWLLAYLGKSVR
ncbi:MAG: hypothetical protein AAGH40_11620 [Verrucomicrobiota bacterium]